MTNEQAIAQYTELQQNLYTLEAWARQRGLQFVWNLTSKTWSLVKIAYGTEEEAENAWIAHHVEEREASNG